MSDDEIADAMMWETRKHHPERGIPDSGGVCRIRCTRPGCTWTSWVYTLTDKRKHKDDPDSWTRHLMVAALHEARKHDE